VNKEGGMQLITGGVFSFQKKTNQTCLVIDWLEGRGREDDSLRGGNEEA